jgi:tripartite-type tricarboxylate transporter receptor subunit TctC
MIGVQTRLERMRRKSAERYSQQCEEAAQGEKQPIDAMRVIHDVRQTSIRLTAFGVYSTPRTSARLEMLSGAPPARQTLLAGPTRRARRPGVLVGLRAPRHEAYRLHVGTKSLIAEASALRHDSLRSLPEKQRETVTPPRAPSLWKDRMQKRHFILVARASLGNLIRVAAGIMRSNDRLLLISSQHKRPRLTERPAASHMKTSLRVGTSLLLVCTLFALESALAQSKEVASTYPVRPIRFVIPFAPGGSSDTIVRAMGPQLGDQLGQQIVLDNRSGASGALGTQIIAKALPDGHTIGLAYIATMATNPAISGDVGYDPVKDFAPITQLTASANVLAIHPSVGVSTVKELIALAKAKPGQLNYASGGIGTIGHMSAELLQHAAGIRLNHIVYKGSGQAVIDLLGGHVGILVGGMSAVAGHAKVGKLKLLAVTGKQRMSIAPDIPTIAESGYPGFEAVGWFGALAPARTPKPIVARLNSEIIKAVQMPVVRDRLVAIGFDVVTSTPEEFARYIAAEVATWRTVAKQMGLKAN